MDASVGEMSDTRVTIERVTTLSDNDIASLQKLVAQLSSHATPDAAHLRQVAASENMFLYCARNAAGEIIGTLSLATFLVPTGTRAWIEDVVVDDSARGQGIATLLVHAAFAEAAALGVRTIDLTSRPSRIAANRLYERLGFVQRETNVWRFTGKHS